MNLTPAALAAAAKGDLENARLAATPGGIEAQERTGQALLVASSNMPIEMRPSRQAFEAVGFQFGRDVDELFLKADLPPGWSKASTDHDMHSTVKDEQGRDRVGVFYKAAFYDRRADAYLICRYQVGSIYADDTNDLAKDEVIVTIVDAGKVIHQFDKVKRSEQFDGPRKAADAWLAEHYPNAADPTSYW